MLSILSGAHNVIICTPRDTVVLEYYAWYLFMLFTSGNRTPGSRFYSDLLDTLADSVCIHQLLLKRRSKR